MGNIRIEIETTTTQTTHNTKEEKDARAFIKDAISKASLERLTIKVSSTKFDQQKPQQIKPDAAPDRV
jgi:hypothetical protein